MREFLSGYILGEIWLPLLLLFLLGYLLSWLIHRWRRRIVSSGDWNAMSTRAGDAERDLAAVSAARDEAMHERTALSGRINGLTTDLESSRTELTAATNSSQKLTADLKTRDAELKKLRAESEGYSTKVKGLEADLSNAQGTISGFASLEGDHKKLKGQFDGANARIAELEGASTAANDELAAAQAKASEADARAMELEGQLRAAQADLSGAQADLAGSNDKIGSLEAAAAAAAVTAASLKAAESKSGDLEASLEASRAELDTSQTRIADLDGRLAQTNGDLEAANARISELEGELGGAQSQIAGFANLEADAGQSKSDLEAANARIAELEAALDGEDEEDVANAEVNAAHTAAWASGAWIVGTTALGTAGVEPDHVDDLKKIKGIGPKLEGVLNEKGVQTYEQLAALNADEQEIVNGALDAFPGRIYRDEWVPQAQAIMSNGHAPLTNAKKADLDSANTRIDELESALADAESANDRVAELEGQLGDANAKASELDGANARIAALEGELGDANDRASKLDPANARIAELESELGGANNQIAGFANLESDLGGAKSDLDGANARIAELEGANNDNTAEIGQLRIDVTEKDRRIEALEAAARNAADQGELDAMRSERDAAQGDLDKVRSDRDSANAEAERLRAELAAKPDVEPVDVSQYETTIARRDKTIEELRAALKGYKDMPEDIQRLAAWQTGGWKKGQTKLGTDGSDHTDDLKVISGIGPQMEQLLQSFGIKSWEQLAALDKAGVETVDGALEDFPGRITRDQWVEQAKGIMAAGHNPAGATPPKRAKPKKKKSSWQKGKTKLGTPGVAADRKDDLKVINGIGPKMEGILNGFGIRTWEQVGALKKDEVAKVTEAIDTFPGRIERDEWVPQAKDLCKRFKDVNKRPTRKTFLNDSGDDDPFN